MSGFNGLGKVFAAVVFCVLGASGLSATALAWDGSDSTDWNDANNWTPAQVPTSADDVSIPDAATTLNDPTLPASGACASLTILTSGTLNGSTGTLNVAGTWVNNGTFNHGTSTVTFDGSTNSALSGTGTLNFYLLTVAKNSTSQLFTATKAITVASNMTLSGGEFINGAFTHVITGNFLKSGGRLTINGDYSHRLDVNGNFTVTGGDVNFSGFGYIFCAGNVDISGANSFAVTAGHNMQMDGTGSFTVSVSGTNNKFWTFAVAGTSSTITALTDINTEFVYHYRGVLDTNAKNLRLFRGYIGYNTATLKMVAGATFDVGSDGLDGTYFATWTVQSGWAEDITGGTITVRGKDYFTVGNVHFYSGCNFTPTGGTFRLIGNDATKTLRIQEATNFAFRDLQLGDGTNTTTVALWNNASQQACDVDGTLTINANCTLNSNSKAIEVAAGWNKVGSFTQGTGTVTIDGAGTCTIAGSTTFRNLRCVTAGKQINFTAGSTQTIVSGGVLTLTGTSGSQIVLRSTSAGNRWFITDSGTENVSWVNVQDGEAANLITVASGGTDAGNNLRWIFAKLDVHETDGAGPVITYNQPVGGGRNFGVQAVGYGATAALTIYIENDGVAALSLGSAALGGTHANQFIIPSSGLPTSVPPGSNASFQIAFDPSSPGIKNAQVTFTHNDNGVLSPFIVNVRGFGVPNPPGLVPPSEPRVGSITAQDLIQSNFVAGVDLSPLFSAVFEHDDPVRVATEARIQVASDAIFTNVLWTSAWISITPVPVGERCQDLPSTGLTVASETTYYYRLSFTDDIAEITPWSEDNRAFWTFPPSRVAVAITAVDTLVGQPARFLLSIQADDPDLLCDLDATIDLGALAPYFEEGEQYFLTRDPLTWSVTAALNGNLLNVELRGLSNPDYRGLPSLGPRGEIAVLTTLNSIPSGTYELPITAAQPLLPAGMTRELTVLVRGDTLEVGIPHVKSTALPNGNAGKSYHHEISLFGLKSPVSSSVTNGSLPAGFELDGPFIHGEPEIIGQQGAYSFDIQFVSADSVVVTASFNLAIDVAGPQLDNVVAVIDQDGNGVLSPGDKLEVHFDEKIALGPNAINAFQREGMPGSNVFGTGASIISHPVHQQWAMVTLGTGFDLPIVSAWSDENAKVIAVPVAGGITDLEGAPVVTTDGRPVSIANTLNIVEDYWVVGTPITPVQFTAFSLIPTDVDIDVLPDGVTRSGEGIAGTPTLASLEGEPSAIYSLRFFVHHHEVLYVRSVIIYASDPLLSLTLLDDENVPADSRVGLAGDILEFQVHGAAVGIPINVVLDGVVLEHAPGSNSTRLRVILPSATLEDYYTLTASQNGQFSQDVTVLVETVESENPGFIEPWFFEADGQQYFNLIGLGLNSATAFFVNGIQVIPVSQDDSYAIVPLPSPIDYLDFEQGFEVSASISGGGSISFTRAPRISGPAESGQYFNGDFLILGGGVEPPVPIQDKKDDAAAAWLAEVLKFIKLLQEAIKETDPKKSADEQAKIVNFLKAVIAHESGQLKYREQIRGPAVTLAQIEPNSLRTMLARSADEALIKKYLALISKMKEEDIQKLLDAFKKEKENNWDSEAGKKLKEILTTKSDDADKLAAILCRLDFRKHTGQKFDQKEFCKEEPEDGTEPTEKVANSANDPTGKDIGVDPAAPGTGKWFFAEQWRRWYNTRGNKRQCKDPPPLHDVAKEKWGECKSWETDEEWIARRKKLREEFVKSLKAFFKAKSDAEGG